MLNRIITLLVFLTALATKTMAQDILKVAEQKVSKEDAKSYHVKSLDGKNAIIRVLPDYESHILRICYLKDTLSDYVFWGVPADIHILNSNFIEVIYRVRMGSGEGGENMILLCVDKNKLCQAMAINSLNSSEDGDGHGIYKIEINLNGINRKNYKLNVHIRDEVSSKRNPENNYKYNNQTMMYFDAEKDAFYSIKQFIDDSFSLFNPKTQKAYKQQIKGTIPVQLLGNNKYYLIQGEWYSVGDNNQLSKFLSTAKK